MFIWLRTVYTPRDSLPVRRQRMEINAWNEKECGMFPFSFVLSYASFLRSFAIYRSLRFSSLLFVNENLQIFIEYLSASGRKQSNDRVWNGPPPRYNFIGSLHFPFWFRTAPGTFDRGIQNVETKTADATLSTRTLLWIRPVHIDHEEKEDDHDGQFEKRRKFDETREGKIWKRI